MSLNDYKQCFVDVVADVYSGHPTWVRSKNMLLLYG